MRSKFSQQLIREIASKYKLTAKQVEDIVKSPFSFQHDVQRYRCNKQLMIYPTVRIPYFGLFLVTERMKNKLFISKKNGTTGTKQKDMGSRDKSGSNPG